MPLVADLIDPFPGRAARALEISIVCMLVVLVAMTYGIPDAATATYVVFFAAKEDCGGSIIANIALVIVVTIVVAMAFGFALLSLNSPEARILIMAAWAFAAFFLATASKLAPLAATVGLIVAYAIDLFASAPLGEIATRGLLYAWLFVATPMVVFLVYNILFGRRPDRLVKEELVSRFRAIAALLDDPCASHMERVAECCRSGNDELLKLLKMAGLFHFQPPSAVARLRVMVVMSYNLSIATLLAVDAESAVPNDLSRRVSELASAVAERNGEATERKVA